MKYSIEDVKRLVPEARKVQKMLNCVYFNIGSRVFVANQPDGQILLHTRRQLEIARESLSRIGEPTNYGHNEQALIAGEALAAIEGVTK